MKAQGLATALGLHLPKDRYDEDGNSVGTYCTCGDWEGGYFADGEAGPFDEHLAQAVIRWLETVAGDAAVREAALAIDPPATGPHARFMWDRGCNAAVAALLAAVRAA